MACRPLLPWSSGSPASHPKWSQLLPLQLSDFAPACRGCSIPKGRVSHAQDAQQRAKSSEVRGVVYSGFDSIFQEFNFSIGFFETIFILPSILMILKFL